MEIHDPYIPVAIVNSLITTAVLWTFWTPFIIILAAPLINAQLKDGVCNGLRSVATNPQTNPMDIYKIPKYQPSVPAINVLNLNSQEFKQDNSILTSTFIVTAILVIFGSLIAANRIIVSYNLNWSRIVWFNVLMACIIMAIESLFFGFVAVKYVPFDIVKISHLAQSQMVSYLESMIKV